MSDDAAAALGLDPGRPPRLPDPADPVDPMEDPAPTPVGASPTAIDLPGWTPESAGRMFRVVGVALNALAGMKLPDDPMIDDVFIPTDEEVALFGEAAASYANRHPFIAKHAGKGDVAVMGSVLVEYGVREVGRIKAYRSLQEEAAAEAGIPGLGVRPVQP